MKLIFLFLILLPFIPLNAQSDPPFILALGIAQDGGYPHMGCEKECCARVEADPSIKRYVVSLALVDPAENKWWLIEATPDIKEQLHLFRQLTNRAYAYLPNGIILTHAHIGHYTGLMQLGKEVMNTNEIPVYVLPRMKQFLQNNGPWSQLVSLKNILLKDLIEGSNFQLDTAISIEAFTVPHRDEFSETAGFKIRTNKKSYLFIPDIDKWSKWNQSIVEMVKNVNVAFLDATFLKSSELKNRKIEEVPHPLVSETMELFESARPEEKSKIKFIHFNHTNPLLWSKEKKLEILMKGFGLAEQGKIY